MRQTTEPPQNAARCDGLACGTNCGSCAGIWGIIDTSAANRSAADITRTSQTMANLSRFLLIDSISGTVLCADQCYLVNDDALSVQQWDDMESMSDTEVGTLAINHGRKLSDVVTLRAVLPGEIA
jgi:hypothetical protein